MTTVANPPALVRQETPAWCFAAAEAMIRTYYHQPSLSQYAIARQVLAARVTAQDPDIVECWARAVDADRQADRSENGGANKQSAIVALVDGSWGNFNADVANGKYKGDLAAADVKAQIAANKIFVVGDHQHFYVAYGYEADGATLLVRDPMGSKTSISLADLKKNGSFLAVTY